MSRPIQHRDVPRATTEDAERLGQVIDGRYRLDALVGRGGMGVVYKAEHVGIRRTVALKLLHAGLAAVPELRSRFEREARAIGVISHPNCVDVSDFGELPDGSLFLVMEFLEGRSLGDVLDRERALEPRRAMRILRHVLAGLGHAHRKGVVHRDVKPENVFLVRDGDDPEFAKILDFGIAKLVSQQVDDGVKLTQAGVAFGTPVYMSPEQALGNPVDARADLYGAAVMAYEMIAGRPPFFSDDKLEVLSMHTVRPVPPIDETRRAVLGPAAPPVPEEIARVVLRGLAKRPEDRWPGADAFIAAIDEALVALAVDDDPTHAGRRPLVGGDGRSLIPDLDEADTRVDDVDPDDLTPTRAIAAAPPASEPIELVARAAPPATPSAIANLPAAPAPPSPRPALPPGHGTRGLTTRVVAVVRRQPLIALGAGAGVVVVIATILLLATGDPPDERPLHPPSLAAAQAAEKLERGDPAAAIKALEERRDEIASDPLAQLQLGHAHAAKREQAPALLAYRRALELDPRLEADPTLRANLGAISDDTDHAAAMAAYELLIGMTRDRDARARLLAAASAEDPGRRRAAVALVERLDLGRGVDWLASYRLDLEQGETCARRREAVAKLRALRDPRAIPALEQAIERKGKVGKTRGKPINKCLADDARAAVAFLHGLAAEVGAPGEP